MTGLQNGNIRNKLCSILKLNSLSDKELLENLSLAILDEHELDEYSDKFNKCRTDISIVKTSENTKKNTQTENKLLTELHSLKVSLDEIKNIKAIHS